MLKTAKPVSDQDATGAVKQDRQAVLVFSLVSLSMFLNLILAFLNARGFPISSSTVIAAQVLVTALALPAFFSPKARFRATAILALSFIVLSAVVTNLLNPFNPKTIYDSLLIPIYIALGMSAGFVRAKWMNLLLMFVLAISLLEILLPSVYVSLFNPVAYLSATREWISDKDANGALEAGFYTGSFRARGSQFALVDHRIGGPFLEPLSLGYFAFLTAIYYAGLHRGSFIIKLVSIIACLMLAIASDTRAAAILILLCSALLMSRVRLHPILLWLSFPITMVILLLIYLGNFSFLYGDMYFRLNLTFDAIWSAGLSKLLVGMVPLNHVGDSGVLGLIRAVGLLGVPVAIWLYSGAYTYNRGYNASFFIMIAIYLTITLMLGGASLSIKTASLLGYLVGIASYLQRGRLRIRNSSREDNVLEAAQAGDRQTA